MTDETPTTQFSQERASDATVHELELSATAKYEVQEVGNQTEAEEAALTRFAEDVFADPEFKPDTLVEERSSFHDGTGDYWVLIRYDPGKAFRKSL